MKEMNTISSTKEEQSINDPQQNDNNDDNDEEEEDDIIIENTTSDISSLKGNHTKQRKADSANASKNDYSDITEEQMKRMISDFDPPKIKDWPNIPYKTIFITLLLFFSSILFLYNGITKYKNNETWDQYLSYMLLGGMLIIPGAYYSFILVNIIIGSEGYEYKILPKLNN